MSDKSLPFGFAEPVIVLPPERRVRSQDEQADEPSGDQARKEQG